MIMKKEYKLIGLGFLLIFVVDLIGSLTSLKFNFPYSYFLPLSILIYIIIPVLNTRQSGLKMGVLSGMLLGFFDSTIGWKLSNYLGANTSLSQEQLTTGIWIFVIIVNTIFATILGLFVSSITTIIIKRK